MAIPTTAHKLGMVTFIWDSSAYIALHNDVEQNLNETIKGKQTIIDVLTNELTESRLESQKQLAYINKVQNNKVIKFLSKFMDIV